MLEALVGYLTLQFFGFGSSIRYPSSVVFVGMMCVADGTLYLEPHHTRRLSDGGPDHPRWVGALCPNCHREIHHGADGVRKNKRLQQSLGKLEGT